MPNQIIPSLLGVIEICQGNSQKLAVAWAASIEKALVVGWHKTDLPNTELVNAGIVRAAERAAHDYK